MSWRLAPARFATVSQSTLLVSFSEASVMVTRWSPTFEGGLSWRRIDAAPSGVSAAEASLFASRIDEDYRVTDMIVDNLPAATRVVEPATPTTPSPTR